MTVDAYSECPVCGNNLTNESTADTDIERYAINKYFLTYLVRKHLFSVIVTIVVLLRIVLSAKSFGLWQVISIISSVFMWVEALYKNLIVKIFNNIYSDKYLESTHKITIYMCGILSVVAAFL
ncbi:MAG: hypothetical protein IJ333_08460 [Clostridia bacterium]|nr:hypothetical protein [Clostridia bacterium]